MIIISLCGVLCNILVMYIILSQRKLRSGCGILIAHLLFINVTLCLVHMPILSISTYFYAPYVRLGKTFCNYTILFYYSSLYTVDWAACLISVNRYVAIFLPHHYRKCAGRYGVISMIVTGWIIAFSCNLVLFYGVGGAYQSTKPWGACGITVSDAVTYPTVTVICVTLPVCLEGVVYLSIFAVVGLRKLINRRRVSVADVNADVAHQHQFKKRFRVARMLFCSYVWYSICFLPAPIASSLYPVQYASLPLLQLFLRVLLVLGYATIPLIYLIMNNDYRSGLKIVGKRLRRLLGQQSFMVSVDATKSGGGSRTGS
ncbi:trace amine-associated receptor 7a-like [Paramacrobiotus metropolitanus]|uniref:trace amine-associated receptor 7a-like n=1 Tax=Paramacrobiotus metropolitanus TaxID=2943436 RepID=UPI002445BA12|nr:trace amine-associated receptor 7a-like [Paramacrobiotus metropolitanus]